VNAVSDERPITRSRGFRCSMRPTAISRKVHSGEGERSNAHYEWVRVDGIPMDSIARALVVIPTTFPQNHSKSNSGLIGK
jgi:hypothetical protein